MEFVVISSRPSRLASAHGQAYLVTDNWNDYLYRTLFHLWLPDTSGQLRSIGAVKIATDTAGSAPYSTLDDGLPDRFHRLDSRFFSLGQDSEYYSALNAIGAQVRIDVLNSLRDIALDDRLYDEVIRLDVTRISLMRGIPELTVANQFRRIAHGGTRLITYRFNYRRPTQYVDLEFEVHPESTPPTNIHVLIGQNGAGKTRLMRGMVQAFKDRNLASHFQRLNSETGSFHTAASHSDVFTNMVTVSFSAFDPFDPLQPLDEEDSNDCVQISLLKAFGDDIRPKTGAELDAEFVGSFLECAQEPFRSRWLRAVSVLRSDPNFSDSGFATIFDGFASPDSNYEHPQETSRIEDLGAQASDLYTQLSSGHRIVLLTITRLVETVQEQTLVLLDEPESHLHPPLLSAFIRALSDLLIEQNGVAVIATHSPVVLQEVPRSCVWKIWRAGAITLAERPNIETFGEGVGLLTHDVFGLEVTRSGFHSILTSYVDQGLDYHGIVRAFGGRLGQEAKAILQGLIAARESE